MRIIAGTHRGRPILAPRGTSTTRPIIDRVKESLFNRLLSLGMLDQDPPWHALDIFSGTGSLGLEALSRGASTCTFIDQDRDAINRLNDNLDQLGLTDRGHIVQASAFAGYWVAGLPHKPIRVAFLDPPYPMAQDEKQLSQLLGLIESLKGVMEQGGVVTIRTPREIDLPELPGYDGPVSASYGGMTLHFYQTPLNKAEAGGD